ncbi:helix-turn-helix transcriptional regulator [Planctomonas psychrotolerans]|uniref:helix-turn-helix transcriptional regulator n=1 Tax=Planctomonas psychrotolerans TaxID=2528712 RepID=UPI00123B1BC3|nr:WYL domain-containing protein [Planctomonas psychrotolerans]
MAERQAPLQAQDKLTFLLALVPYLTERGPVSVAEAAAHFRVSPEQLRKAVRLIAVSGVPGDTSSYQHGDLFDIAWDDFEQNDQIVLTHMVAIDDSPRFSAREAAALIAGLQYLSALPEHADREIVTSLMAKLARGSSSNPSQVAVAGSDSDDELRIIRAAVADGRRVEFDYRTARGASERRHVDPLRIESIDQDWYLRGWDHDRGALRTFRLDRITHLTATTKPIEHRPEDLPLPDTLFEPSEEDLVVTIDVAAAALPLLGDYIPDGAKTRPSATRNGWLETTLRVAHYHGLKRLIAGMPGVVVVLQPEDARRAVADWASAGAARYL